MLTLIAAHQPTLEFNITPRNLEGIPCLHVEVHVSHSTASRLRLPNESFGQTKLFENVRNLQIEHKTFPAAITVPIGSSRNRLAYSYDLAQRWKGIYPKNQEFHSGSIADFGFSQEGESLLVLPDSNPNVGWKVRMHWYIPTKWTLGNSFGMQRNQNFQASLGELREALFVGGDYKFQSQRVEGGTITVAMRGSDWPFSPSTFAGLAAKIVDEERKFWQPGAHHPQFLVALEPTDDELGYFHGLGRTNGFGLWLPRRTGLSAYLKTTIAHEMMHSYTPGPLSNLDPPQWFCEGFTDYFAAMICHDKKLISDSDYVGLYNDRWRHYYQSRARNLSESEEFKHRFDSNDHFNLPYWRGMLLATNWDSRIRASSGGHQTLAEAVKLAMSLANQGRLPAGAKGIDSAIRVLYPQGIDSDVEKFVAKGETIVPDPDALGPKAVLIWKAFGPGGTLVPQFELRH